MVPCYLKRFVVQNEDTGDEYAYDNKSDAYYMLGHLRSLGYLAVMFSARVF